jgi:hydrogenase maturation protease
MAQFAPVLLAAIGNDLMGDDGVGPEMIRRIEEAYEIPPDLEFADTGTAGFLLMDLLAGRRAAVLVDALKLEGSEPGELRRFERDELEAQGLNRLSPHQPSFGETLRAAEAMGGNLESLVLLGVAGASFEMGDGLSDPVRAALPRLEVEVVDALRRVGVELRPKRSDLRQ